MLGAGTVCLRLLPDVSKTDRGRRHMAKHLHLTGLQYQPAAGIMPLMACHALKPRGSAGGTVACHSVHGTKLQGSLTLTHSARGAAATETR